MADVVSAFALLVCHVVALIAITALAEGKARVLGTLGVITLFLGTALGALNGSLAPWVEITTGTKVDVYGLGLVAVAGVGAVGLVLLALGVVATPKVPRPRGGR